MGPLFFVRPRRRMLPRPLARRMSGAIIGSPRGAPRGRPGGLAALAAPARRPAFRAKAAGIGFLAAAFADFLPELWEGASAHRSLLAALSIGFLTFLNWAGVREGRNAQITLSLLKAAGFLLIVGACFLTGGSTSPPPSTTPSPFATSGLVALAVAFFGSWQLIQETYGGYFNSIYCSEENADPGRSLPRAVFGSALVVAVIYLSAVGAMLHVLGSDALATSVLPLADAARSVMGERAGRVVVLVALLSLLGNMNGAFMFTPRILFALARDGSFTRAATQVNTGGTPAPALLTTSGVALALAVTNSFEQLFFLTAFLGLLVSASMNASLFAIRRREPALGRPYRARGYPVLPAIATVVPAILASSALYVSTRSAVIGLAVTTLAYPVYRLTRRRARPAGLAE